ncbi:MAG: RDD family protein [Chlorobi bacterium]|nr:RDD family protein [Chlorobiota bacterium]
MESQPTDFYKEKDVLGLEKPEVTEPDQIQEDEIKEIDIYQDFEFPTLLQRVQALFIDTIIIVFVFFSTSYLIDFAGSAPNWLRATIIVFMLYLYEPVLVSTIGGTIGHRALKLRVRRYNNPEKRLIIVPALFRTFLKWLLGWLSFLTVTFNKKRRAIHDMGSGSIVVSLG